MFAVCFDFIVLNEIEKTKDENIKKVLSDLLENGRQIQKSKAERDIAKAIKNRQIKTTKQALQMVQDFDKAKAESKVMKATAKLEEISKPKADKPKADKPKADKPKADKPKADKPKADKPTGSKPTGSKPTGSKPKADKPTGSKPTGSKPKADKPTGSKAKANK